MEQISTCREILSRVNSDPNEHFFDLKFWNEIWLFFSREIFYAPWREILKCSPLGSDLSLSFFIYLLQTLFWSQILIWNLSFFRAKYFIPRGGSYCNAPLWGQIWVSFFFISSTENNLRFQIMRRNRPFFAIDFFSPEAGATVMLPQAALWGPIWVFFLYLPLQTLFWSQILEWNRPLFIQHFLSPLVGADKMLSHGVPFESFFLYLLPQTLFWFQILIWNRSFFSKKFLSPVAGANVMFPYGVPFESLSFIYLPLRTLFWSQIL